MDDDDGNRDDADGFAACGLSVVLFLALTAGMWWLLVAEKLNRPGG
jgi:hypothetical protein